MSLTEETSTGFQNFEGESDDDDKHYGDEATPLVPQSRKGDRPGCGLYNGLNFDFDFDGWMRKYLIWTYERPLLSRCIVSAITASVGAMLARVTTTGNNSKLSVRSQNRQQRTRHEGIDMLEVISFAVHGGLVAGPLSYYM